MGFRDFPPEIESARLLQRALHQSRLGHAYLLNGSELTELEIVARTLAKTINCAQPLVSNETGWIDSCDHCRSCKLVDADSHPDVNWTRPESKSRVITVPQIRNLLQAVHLKPLESKYKVVIVSGVDRLNTFAANSFLKTLEEPPPGSLFLLLTTDPQNVIETIVSRSLRLSFSYERQPTDPRCLELLENFIKVTHSFKGDIWGRYQSLGVITETLTGTKEKIEVEVTKKSPLSHHDDIDPRLKEKWEDEDTALIESEYRKQRSALILTLQWWLRDVWMCSLGVGAPLAYPQFHEFTRAIGSKVAPDDLVKNLEVMEKLQKTLATNAQETLSLEVALLQLSL